MKAQAKAVLRALGIPKYTFRLRRFLRTIKLPKSYDIEFASDVVSFLTDRPYTKEWFYRNRRKGAHKGWHEPSITFLLERLAQRDSTFVDVGSHLGYFSILFSSIAGNTSLAIELDPSNFKELQRAVSFQPAPVRDRIALVHCGVADAADTIELPAKRALGAGRSIPHAARPKGRRVTVNVLTLDEIVQSHNFSPDTIKIDVEGFEVRVLAGATNILLKFQPLLIIEVHPKRMNRIQHNPSMVSMFLRDHGYLLYCFDDHRSISVSSLTEVHQISETRDHTIVCIHKQDSSRRALLTCTRLMRPPKSA